MGVIKAMARSMVPGGEHLADEELLKMMQQIASQRDAAEHAGMGPEERFRGPEKIAAMETNLSALYELGYRNREMSIDILDQHQNNLDQAVQFYRNLPPNQVAALNPPLPSQDTSHQSHEDTSHQSHEDTSHQSHEDASASIQPYIFVYGSLRPDDDSGMPWTEQACQGMLGQKAVVKAAKLYHDQYAVAVLHTDETPDDAQVIGWVLSHHDPTI